MFTHHAAFVDFCLNDKSFDRILRNRLSVAIQEVKKRANVNFLNSALRTQLNSFGNDSAFPLGQFKNLVQDDARVIWDRINDAFPKDNPVGVLDIEDVVAVHVYEHLWLHALNAVFTSPESEGESRHWTDLAAERALARIAYLETTLVSSVVSGIVVRSLDSHSYVLELGYGDLVPRLPLSLASGASLYESDLVTISAGVWGNVHDDDEFLSIVRSGDAGLAIANSRNSTSPGYLDSVTGLFLSANLYAGETLFIRVQSRCSRSRFEQVRERAVACVRSALKSVTITNQLNINWESLSSNDTHDKAVSEIACEIYQRVRTRQDAAINDWKLLCELAIDRDCDAKSLRARLHRAANYLLVADDETVPLEHRFLACVSALEASVSRGKEAVSEMLAQSVAAIVEHEPSQRSIAIKRVKKLYGIRSKVAHGELPLVPQQDYEVARKLAAAVVLSAMDREAYWKRLGNDPEPGDKFADAVYEAAVTGRSVDGTHPHRDFAQIIWKDRSVLPNN